jgi:prepilin-type N-terminal cleavage/methylation domain-containing protein
MSQTTRASHAARRRTACGGFTLIELVIGIGIGALVLATVAALMMASFVDAARGDAKIQAGSVATYATNRMVSEVREAKRAWFTPYEWQWGTYDTLWIVYPEETVDGWYDRASDGELIAYILWNDRLYRYECAGDGSFHQMVEHVESIGFSGDGNVVTISVTAEVEGERASRSERVFLRNS